LLAGEEESFKINVGISEYVLIKSRPVAFKSQVSYIDPDESREALDDLLDDDELDSIAEETKASL
jgi:hypothetical protein